MVALDQEECGAKPQPQAGTGLAKSYSPAMGETWREENNAMRLGPGQQGEKGEAWPPLGEWLWREPVGEDFSLFLHCFLIIIE